MVDRKQYPRTEMREFVPDEHDEHEAERRAVAGWAEYEKALRVQLRDALVASLLEDGFERQGDGTFVRDDGEYHDTARVGDDGSLHRLSYRYVRTDG